MQPHHEDLTQGGIFRKILLVAMPIMGTQLLQMTYNLTDMFWLGRMEDSVGAVAASGLAGMFLWLSAALMMFGRIGAEIGVSQNLGGGDRAEAQGFAQEAARIGLLLGALYGLALICFAGPLVSLLQVSEQDVFQGACSYLRIAGLGIPLTYVSASITGGFNGAGNSRLGFWANAAGLIINMILDPLMILGLGWGIRGAAIATIIAQGVVCTILVMLAKRHLRRPFESFHLLGRLTKARVKTILTWSLPVSLESAAFTMLAMVVTSMVSSSYGAHAVAVQRGTRSNRCPGWWAAALHQRCRPSWGRTGARKWARIRRLSPCWRPCWRGRCCHAGDDIGRAFVPAVFKPTAGAGANGEGIIAYLAPCQPFMAGGRLRWRLRGMGDAAAQHQQHIGQPDPPAAVLDAGAMDRVEWLLAGYHAVGRAARDDDVCVVYAVSAQAAARGRAADGRGDMTCSRCLARAAGTCYNASDKSGAKPRG